jgi:uncharacterized membrane-anchored protein YhcB (DUF1043 family)
MLTAFAFLSGLCIGAMITACFDDCRNAHIEKRLIQSQAELADVRKELSLCEAEIAHLVAKRDSRGRFTK